MVVLGLIAFTMSAWSIAVEAQPEAPVTSTTLMTFSGAAGEPVWTAVNDGVMGGVSKGAPVVADGRLRFSGVLSLENNGGFSSVRTVGRVYDLSSADAFILRVQGDGRTYQLRLSTDARYRRSDVSYRADFETKAGEWMEVRIPFDAFVPTYRGDRLDGPPLNRAKIEEIGLLIGDGREGPFLLLVDWIKVVGSK